MGAIDGHSQLQTLTHHLYEEKHTFVAQVMIEWTYLPPVCNMHVSPSKGNSYLGKVSLVRPMLHIWIYNRNQQVTEARRASASLDSPRKIRED